MRTGATNLVICDSAHARLTQHFLKPHNPGETVIAYDRHLMEILIRCKLPCFRMSVTAGGFAVSAETAALTLALLPERLMLVAD